MEKAEIQALIREAFAAQKFAYVPYSRFHVGAVRPAGTGAKGTMIRQLHGSNLFHNFFPFDFTTNARNVVYYYITIT